MWLPFSLTHQIQNSYVYNMLLNNNNNNNFQEVTLTPEEEKEFWTAVGGAEARARLKSVLARQKARQLNSSIVGKNYGLLQVGMKKGPDPNLSQPGRQLDSLIVGKNSGLLWVGMKQGPGSNLFQPSIQLDSWIIGKNSGLLLVDLKQGPGFNLTQQVDSQKKILDCCGWD